MATCDPDQACGLIVTGFRNIHTSEEGCLRRLCTLSAAVCLCVSVCRTFSPFWAVWKAFVEKLASLHMQMMHTCSDLLKDMVRYSEEQHKKHKMAS